MGPCNESGTSRCAHPRRGTRRDGRLPARSRSALEALATRVPGDRADPSVGPSPRRLRPLDEIVARGTQALSHRLRYSGVDDGLFALAVHARVVHRRLQSHSVIHAVHERVQHPGLDPVSPGTARREDAPPPAGRDQRGGGEDRHLARGDRVGPSRTRIEVLHRVVQETADLRHVDERPERRADGDAATGQVAVTVRARNLARAGTGDGGSGA